MVLMSWGSFFVARNVMPARLGMSTVLFMTLSARVSSILGTLLPSLLGSDGALLVVAASCALAALVAWREMPETVGRGLPETAMPQRERRERQCGNAAGAKPLARRGAGHAPAAAS